MFVGIFGLRSWDWSSEELARQTPGLKIKVLTIFPLWWKIFLLVSKVFSRMVAPQKEHLKKNTGKSLLLPSRLLQNLDQISTPSPTITKNRTEYIGCSVMQNRTYACQGEWNIGMLVLNGKTNIDWIESWKKCISRGKIFYSLFFILILLHRDLLSYYCTVQPSTHPPFRPQQVFLVRNIFLPILSLSSCPSLIKH